MICRSREAARLQLEQAENMAGRPAARAFNSAVVRRGISAGGGDLDGHRDPITRLGGRMSLFRHRISNGTGIEARIGLI